MSFVTRYLEPALVERLNHLQLSARSVVEGSITGQHRSPVKGASVEFRQHRFYTPGDEPRRLDWRVLGRTDRPYIKEYDEETNLRCMLMLDCSGSMAYGGKFGTKFDYAAKLVASLAYLMLGQTETVGLALCGTRVEQLVAPRSGTAQLSRIIDVLERAAPTGEARVGPAMQEVADRLGRRSLVIALTDGFAPIASLRQGLARLGHDRHETILLQVLDKDEVEFPFRTWSRFRGMEGERAQLCEPAVVRKTYLENFRRHRQDLHETCRALGVEFHSFVTEKPLIDTITGFLQRRAE
ncbi:MAG: hypothetical protein JWL69_3589 [Phycisphaerales bacterium]|jgi:uncharacterized protein (DUF58 family)|nr:hypothetical protein [Phycisphaerales bacterium]MDB5355966.1 hypothetical protein [Phycisphaerales bacterium]